MGKQRGKQGGVVVNQNEGRGGGGGSDHPPPQVTKGSVLGLNIQPIVLTVSTHTYTH